MDMQPQELARLREKVELLTAERGDAIKSKSAIRRVELQALASLTLQSDQISAAPTQGDFNALQADVAVIFATLKALSNLQGNTALPKAL